MSSYDTKDGAGASDGASGLTVTPIAGKVCPNPQAPVSPGSRRVVGSKPRSRDRTRNVILDAADRIMAQYGFGKMSMQDLAREAGISKKTIYLYFGNKEDVALGSIGRVVESVHDRLGQIALGVLPPVEKLHAMLIERIMGRIKQVKDYYWSLDQLFELVRPAYIARRRVHFAHELELIVRVLREGRKSGDFSVDDEWSTANALLQATNAFLPYNLSIRDMEALDEIESRLTDMVNILLRGLTTEPVVAEAM